MLGTEIKVGLLTGCRDGQYAFGLVGAMISKGLRLDIIGSDEIDSPDLHANPQLNFLNFGGSQKQNAGLARKALRILKYYARLIPYAAAAEPRIFHILWNYKLEYFDRTLLMLYYKLCGKKIVLTLHNVNAGKRDSNDSLLNRLTLSFQYRLADHFFVHTNKMKRELVEDFRVPERAVAVIPYGINNAVPNTELTNVEARQRLGIPNGQNAILFFGNLGPYKGVEFLVAAFQRILTRNANCLLIIAGKPRGGCEKYIAEIQEAINSFGIQEQVRLRIEYIPDEEVEMYFKAADVLVLPYKHIFQSGILFLAYSFGLPVIATDVGSFREDIIEGKTGFLCRPADPVDLAEAIEAYFASDLHKGLDNRRQEIQDYANARHSWDKVSDLTLSAYADLLKGAQPEKIRIAVQVSAPEKNTEQRVVRPHADNLQTEKRT